MDKIKLSNMAFYAYHGVFPEETRLGQKFFVDVEIGADFSQAAKTDDIQHTINYASVYQRVKELVENQRFKLLEALAEAIAGALFQENDKIERLKVEIRKPEAPISGILDAVSVSIKRRRQR